MGLVSAGIVAVSILLHELGHAVAFRIFGEYVKSRYGAEPGFITMNMPRLLDVLEEAGGIQGRLIGYHFYNPPAVQKLLETGAVVAGIVRAPCRALEPGQHLRGHGLGREMVADVGLDLGQGEGQKGGCSQLDGTLRQAAAGEG